jgi:formate hydrogenlyase subunit 6/NADH:ubiquinone oxidoreductase subunit I
MKLPKFRELKEAIRSLLTKPFTNMYPFKPITVPDGFRGCPRYHEEDCIGCLACYEVCPAKAIDYLDDKANKSRVLYHHPEICVFCQQCQNACPTEKGIMLGKEFELASDKREAAGSQSRKELVICDHCGEIVAPLDQLKFLAKKLGSLSYANPTLMLARHIDLQLLTEPIPTDSPNKRAGHLQLICPNCRREMILTEQW